MVLSYFRNACFLSDHVGSRGNFGIVLAIMAMRAVLHVGVRDGYI